MTTMKTLRLRIDIFDDSNVLSKQTDGGLGGGGLLWKVLQATMILLNVV